MVSTTGVRLRVGGLITGGVLVGALIGAAFQVSVRSSPRPGALVSDGAASPAPPRAGSDVGAAIRTLDLVRPSRPKAADDFTLPTLQGPSFRLADQRGKLVFINFWATWCPPCREEMPALEQLWRRHRAEGLVMVAVSLDADPKVVPDFVKGRGITFPVALDPRMQVAGAWGVRALPVSFIIDRHGYVVALALGPRGWNDRAAHELVDGLKP